MSRKLKALVVVAHPDDEVLFFAGLILSKKWDWTLVCVTDANADGRGAKRMRNLAKACRRLGVSKLLKLGFPDLFDKRLAVDELTSRLRSLGENFDLVFTHGVLGEYGHFHHQDVCYATHAAFQQAGSRPGPKIYSVAYNLDPEIVIKLSLPQYQIKKEILAKIYFEEAMGFLNFLPATFCEGFTRVAWSEVQAIYQFVAQSGKLNAKKLSAYKWLREYLLTRQFELKSRPF